MTRVFKLRSSLVSTDTACSVGEELSVFRAEWGVITVNNDSLKALVAFALLERWWWHLQQREQRGATGGQRKTRIQLPPALKALCGRAAAFSPGGGSRGRFLSSRSGGGKELWDSFSGQRRKKSVCFISVGGQKRHPGSRYIHLIPLKALQLLWPLTLSLCVR